MMIGIIICQAGESENEKNNWKITDKYYGMCRHACFGDNAFGM